MLEDEKEDHIPRRAPYRRRRWQIGMSLFLLSNIVGSSIQITTLPLPLLSTLQASGLVFNALMASIILQEPFTKRTALGTLLVTAGAVLISRFSALPEPSHNLNQLLALLVVRNFIVWMSLTLVLVVAVLAGTFVLQYCLSAHRRQKPQIRFIRGMSYGLASGILSAHSLLLAKSAVELLVRTIVDHKNQFNRYQSWLLLLLFLLLALTQLYYLHRGLKLVTTSVLYPFVFCVYNIIAILDGLIYFRQMDRLPPLHAGLIALGTVVLLSGVLALSWRLSDEDHDSAATARLGKADLPQTALTPGMGLVDESGGILSDSPAEDDETAIAETEPLLRREAMVEGTMPVGRRKRRSTFKEVQGIWDELRDEEAYHETMKPQRYGRSSSGRRSVSGPQRTASGEGVGKLPLAGAKTAPSTALTDTRRRASAPLPRQTGQKDNDAAWYQWDWWRRRRRNDENGNERTG